MDSSNKKMRRIYIRHADKEYANGDANLYKHDPGITSAGVEKAKIVAKHLVDQWGIPDKIIVSPYRRTRETAKILRSTLIKPGLLVKIPIHVDRELSEYLGNHRNIPIDVTESTLFYEPPHPETFSTMKNRVKVHHEKITKYMKRNGGVIWIVTHGLIMRQVGFMCGIKMPREFPNLTCLSISDTEPIRGETITFHEGADPINEEDDSEFNSDDNLQAREFDYFDGPPGFERHIYERSTYDTRYDTRYEISRNDSNSVNRWDLLKNNRQYEIKDNEKLN